MRHQYRIEDPGGPQDGEFLEFDGATSPGMYARERFQLRDGRMVWMAYEGPTKNEMIEQFLRLFVEKGCRGSARNSLTVIAGILECRAKSEALRKKITNPSSCAPDSEI
jgi:hypothetical protein